MSQATAPVKAVTPLIAEVEQETQITRRVLERVAGDKLTWKPHAKSMSLGQLALHVATTPGALASILATDTYEVGSFDQPEATSAAELIPTLKESVGTARQFLMALDEERAAATWKATQAGRELMAAPRIALVRSIMLNHWYHHRGQLSVYLRLLNVPVPSIYGPSADENPFAG